MTLTFFKLTLYPLPFHSVFADNTLLYAVTLTYDPMFLTFDL